MQPVTKPYFICEGHITTVTFESYIILVHIQYIYYHALKTLYLIQHAMIDCNHLKAYITHAFL